MALPLYDNDKLHEGLAGHIGCKVELAQYKGSGDVVLECMDHGVILLSIDEPYDGSEGWEREHIVEVAESAGYLTYECPVHRHVWVREGPDSECGVYLVPTKDNEGVKIDWSDGQPIAKTRAELRDWLRSNV